MQVLFIQERIITFCIHFLHFTARLYLSILLLINHVHFPFPVIFMKSYLRRKLPYRPIACLLSWTRKSSLGPVYCWRKKQVRCSFSGDRWETEIGNNVSEWLHHEIDNSVIHQNITLALKLKEKKNTCFHENYEVQIISIWSSSVFKIFPITTMMLHH